MLIRKIDTGDAADVAILSAQLGYQCTIVETEDRIAAINKSTNDAAYVAIYKNKVIGWIHVFCTIRLESGSFCEIGGLITDEKYRKMGIGKALTEQSKLWCAEKKCTRLKVRSNVKRQDAHKFYTRIGFTEVKEQKIFEIDI